MRMLFSTHAAVSGVSGANFLISCINSCADSTHFSEITVRTWRPDTQLPNMLWFCVQ